MVEFLAVVDCIFLVAGFCVLLVGLWACLVIMANAIDLVILQKSIDVLQIIGSVGKLSPGRREETNNAEL